MPSITNQTTFTPPSVTIIGTEPTTPVRRLARIAPRWATS